MALVAVFLAEAVAAVVLAFAGLTQPSCTATLADAQGWTMGNPEAAGACRLLLAHVIPAQLSLALSVVLAVHVTAVAIIAVRAGRRTNRLMGLLVGPEPVLTNVDGRAVHIIDDPSPLCLCAGVLRPRILLSSGAIDRLAPEELRAVVAHEWSHRRRGDPLRLLLAVAFARSVAWLDRGVPSLLADYRFRIECRADREAVDATGLHELVGALVSLLTPHEPPETATAATSSSIAKRIRALERPSKLRQEIAHLALVPTAAMLTIGLVATLMTPITRPASHEQTLLTPTLPAEGRVARDLPTSPPRSQQSTRLLNADG